MQLQSKMEQMEKNLIDQRKKPDEQKVGDFAKILTLVDDFQKTFTRSNFLQASNFQTSQLSQKNSLITSEQPTNPLELKNLPHDMKAYERVFGETKV